MARLLFALVVLAGCATDPAPTADSPETAARVPVEDSAAVAMVAPSDEAAVLALDPDGFRVVDASGAAQPLAFGTPAEDAVETVTALRGEPSGRGENLECGAGPLGYASWADGLTLWTQDGQFGGWALDGEGSSLTTMAGIGIGSTRAELDGVVVAEVMESTLGTEFDAGDLHGILSGPDPDATITNLWAGMSCTFR